MKYRSLYFTNGKLRLIDQTKLPENVKYLDLQTHYDVGIALRTMQVRGSSAVGIAAAYGMALAMKCMVKMNGEDPCNWDEVMTELSYAGHHICEARPNSISVKYAVTRMKKFAKDVVHGKPFDMDYLYAHLVRQANVIMEEDRKSCIALGEYGLPLIRSGMRILTYSNGGALSSSEIGTVLSPVYRAHRENKKFDIYCCETRPLYQGSRLTAWELKESGINPTLICDNMAAQIMKERKVDLVLVGAERVACNGDTANKIGTYGLAILANYHNVPFYVVAPANVFDLKIQDGNGIEIEKRYPYEILYHGEKRIGPDVTVYNPTTDVTPAELITGIVTDHGIITPVNKDNITKMWVC